MAVSEGMMFLCSHEYASDDTSEGYGNGDRSEGGAEDKPGTRAYYRKRKDEYIYPGAAQTMLQYSFGLFQLKVSMPLVVQLPMRLGLGRTCTPADMVYLAFDCSMSLDTCEIPVSTRWLLSRPPIPEMH